VRLLIKKGHDDKRKSFEVVLPNSKILKFAKKTGVLQGAKIPGRRPRRARKEWDNRVLRTTRRQRGENAAVQSRTAVYTVEKKKYPEAEKCG